LASRHTPHTACNCFGRRGSRVEEEANLLVPLAIPVSATCLAPVSAANGSLTLPNTEISVENFGHSTIRQRSHLSEMTSSTALLCSPPAESLLGQCRLSFPTWGDHKL